MHFNSLVRTHIQNQRNVYKTRSIYFTLKSRKDWRMHLAEYPKTGRRNSLCIVVGVDGTESFQFCSLAVNIYVAYRRRSCLFPIDSLQSMHIKMISIKFVPRNQLWAVSQKPTKCYCFCPNNMAASRLLLSFLKS